MNHKLKRPTNVALIALLLAAVSCTAALAEPSRDVLVEAEAFAQSGGWVIDQQSMDQMGSPYVLAHGLGVPVQDATTKVEFAQPGTYRLWLRTRDWVAPWKTPDTGNRGDTHKLPFRPRY